ncbi:MAG: hypothetical protein HY235_18520 [Acidobacteria bacterium]|nr:hypothetical protein [Acidobacteriota bacterium]
MPRSQPNRDSDSLLWTTGELPYSVECPVSLLEEMHGAAQEEFHRLDGAVETGGVLFGRRTEQVVRILSWRPIRCDHAFGPRLALSNHDRQALIEMLEQAQRAPDLQVLEPVGWFVSHWPSGVSMTEEDLDLYQRFFAEPWQVTLVIEPQRSGPARAGFFGRERDGRVRADASYREFSIEGTRSAGVAHPVPEPVAVPLETLQQPDATRWRAWAGVALMLGAVGMVAVSHWRSPSEQTPAQDFLYLHLEDRQGQLRIEWDRSSPALANAEGATLYIQDRGPLSPLRLDRDAAQQGSVTYARVSDDVAVRMVVTRKGQPPLEELARYVGPPAARPESKELRETRLERERLKREAEDLEEKLRQENDRIRGLQKTLRRLEQKSRQR